jgi:F0F1-type ATP synthase membrane subunit a
MSARRRGIIVFIILLVVAVVFCYWTPFIFLPGLGIGMALPVIQVPGEVVRENFLPGVDLTNTLIATLLTDVIVLLFAFAAWRASDGWRKEVPGRFQAFAETLVEGFYNFCYNIAGERLRTTRRPLPLWPLVATIFLFLLAANLSKLIPGMESVGVTHCAHVGINGYPMKPGSPNMLFVDRALDAGTAQTEETEHACEEYFYGYAAAYPAGFPVETAEQIETNVAQQQARIADLNAAGEESLTEEAHKELEAAQYYVQYAEERLETAHAIPEVEARILALEEERAHLQSLLDAEHGEAAEEGDHGEEAEGGSAEVEGAIGEEAEADVQEVTQVPTGEGSFTEEGAAVATSEASATEEAAAINTEEAIGDAIESVDEVVAGEPATEENIEEVAQEAQEEELASTSTEQQIQAIEDQIEAEQTLLNLYRSQLRFPGATLALSNEAMDQGAVPYIFHITPYLRGAATDLSLTVALALMSIVLVQVYGVSKLGLGYFEKFINVSALGNLNKKPMGAIDFLVGLIEIISEIGKIVSLAFRLFGNLFAGGIALLAISFLVSWLVPGVIYGLELIIGSVQALVFAVLTLVFSVQAMESHHGDEAHDDTHIHDDTTAMRQELHEHGA